MVGLLGFIINPWSKPTWFKNCLEARHIACFTIIYLICAKVQIVDKLSQISSFKWYFWYLNQCAQMLKVFNTCVHKFRGSLIYKLDALRLTLVQMVLIFFKHITCVVVSL